MDTPLTLLTEWRKNGDTISDMDNGRISADSVAVGASAGYKSALTFSPLSNTQLGGDDGEYTCSVRVKDQEFIIGNVASGVQTITVKGWLRTLSLVVCATMLTPFTLRSGASNGAGGVCW